MARDKLLEGHMQGLSHALRIVQEGGVEALEKEIKFRGITNIPINVPKSTADKAIDNIKFQVCDTFCLLVCCVLRDEFGFGHDRLQRVIDRFNLKAECLAGEYVTWEDYIKAMKEEVGLDMTIRFNDKDVK